MIETPCLALLRGINVGGNNLIKMAELKKLFEEKGFENVKTYIQSGNILFRSPQKDRGKLKSEIEELLKERFGYPIRSVVVSLTELQEIIEQAPEGFGQQPALYRYDVVFLKEPLTPSEAIKDISTKEGVDTVHAGNHALYFSRLISKASQSRLAKIISLPVYPFMTIRNWNTVTKLLAMMME
mgnify:CR=1 FL=1